MEYFIYGLLCPRSKELRYVGITNRIKGRLQYHLCTSIFNATPCGMWVRQLAESKWTPEIKILESVSHDNPEVARKRAKAIEKRLIRLHNKESDGRLLNVHHGVPFRRSAPQRVLCDLYSAINHGDPERLSKRALLHTIQRAIYELSRDKYGVY